VRRAACVADVLRRGLCAGACRSLPEICKGPLRSRREGRLPSPRAGGLEAKPARGKRDGHCRGGQLLRGAQQLQGVVSV